MPGRPSMPELSPRQSRLMVALACAAVLLIVVVVAIAGGFSSGGSTSTATQSGGGAGNASSGGTKGPETVVRLQPQGGGGGSGAAVFARATGDQPFLDLTLDGLPPPPQSKVYAIWLAVDAQKRQAYPLSPAVPFPQSGPYHNRFQIPGPVIPILPNLQTVDITLADARTLQKQITTAVQKASLVIPESGTTVLSGVVPGASRTSAGTTPGAGATTPGAGGGTPPGGKSSGGSPTGGGAMGAGSANGKAGG